MGTEYTSQIETTLPDALSQFIVETTYEDIPTEAIRIAERCFVDTVGVTLPGLQDGAGGRALQMAITANGLTGGQAHILGEDLALSISEAAFVNATAGHGLDYDDVSDSMDGHPSVPLVGPILAVAEAIELTGKDLLTAYIVGFETQCYLASPISPGHYERGWHATATFGTFGAAAAVASLLDLSIQETKHALNTAASMPAGLKRNFGTMTKPMHAGAAARSGVTAALLAAEGFTADQNAISSDRGFLTLYNGGNDPDFDTLPVLGEQWAIRDDGVSMKKYPCCYFTHSSIAAAATLATKHDIDANDIEAISVTASEGAGDALHHDNPSSGLEGKFSMPYTVASAIVRDRVGLAAFEDDTIDQPDIQAVREHISFTTDPSLNYASHTTTVRIDTQHGQLYEMTRELPPGVPEDPLSDEEVFQKFMECATRSLETDDAEELFTRLNSLREQDDLDMLFRLL